jgi:hypothetical protein
MIQGMWLVARLGRQVYSVRNPERKKRWGLVSWHQNRSTKRESDDDNESLGSCHFFPPAASAAFFSRAIQNKHTVRKRSQPRYLFYLGSKRRRWIDLEPDRRIITFSLFFLHNGGDLFLFTSELGAGQAVLVFLLVVSKLEGKRWEKKMGEKEEKKKEKKPYPFGHLFQVLLAIVFPLVTASHCGGFFFFVVFVVFLLLTSVRGGVLGELKAEAEDD